MKKSYLETLRYCVGKEFRRRVGIRRRTFRQMYKRVRASLNQERLRRPLSNRGKKSTVLTLVDKLLLTCVYMRQDPPFSELGAMFGISESYACKLYHSVW